MRGREESEEVREMRGEGEWIKRKKEEEGGEKMGIHTQGNVSRAYYPHHHMTEHATTMMRPKQPVYALTPTQLL